MDEDTFQAKTDLEVVEAASEHTQAPDHPSTSTRVQQAEQVNGHDQTADGVSGLLRYCRHCQEEVQAASMHCAICSVCSVEVGHHCGFLGLCVHKGNRLSYMSLMLVSCASLLPMIAVTTNEALRRWAPQASLSCGRDKAEGFRLPLVPLILLIVLSVALIIAVRIFFAFFKDQWRRLQPLSWRP